MDFGPMVVGVCVVQSCRYGTSCVQLVKPVRKPLVAVVEPDDSVRRALARLVRSRGWRVTAFSSAAELVASFPSVNPDTIVAAVPGDAGERTAVQAALAPLGGRIPLVYLALDAHEAWRQSALAHGAAVLCKPFCPVTLLELLARLIGKKARGVSARVQTFLPISNSGLIALLASVPDF